MVRSVTGGDETVPTVVVDGVGLVNPTASAVLDLLGGTVPSSGRPSDAAGTARGRITVWVVVAAVVASSFVVDGFGLHALSWGLDGVAVAVYAVPRLLRRLMGSG